MLDQSKIKKLEKRVFAIYKDSELSRKLLQEFSSLDERESSLIVEALLSDRYSIEYIHTQARLDALVSSGTISPELADATTEQSKSLEEMLAASELNTSRDNFLQEVYGYTDPDTLVNPFDKGGKLTRMVNRGDSRESITNYLKGNKYFKEQEHLLSTKDTIKEENYDLKIAVFKFEALMESLNGLVDPEVAPDLKAIAKKKIAKYDADGSIGQMIDSGATSFEVLTSLKDVEQWNTDAYDFITKNDVEIGSKKQHEAWNKFKDVLTSIKDLDAS
jgi:hypothetical protein